MSTPIIIYTDGACLGNPGPGGWGAIVGKTATQVRELGGAVDATTNNRMELLAVIEALDFVVKNSKDFSADTIIVHSDSSYVIQGASKWIHGWKKRGWKGGESGEEIKNIDLWLRLDDVLLSVKKISKIDWRHIEGHVGIAGNERCDLISNNFARGEAVSLYNGSASGYAFKFVEVPARLPSAPKDKSKVYYLSLINGEVFRDQTWSQCEARVKGRQGARYKKCHSREEEAEILRSWGMHLTP